MLSVLNALSSHLRHALPGTEQLGSSAINLTVAWLAQN